MTRRPTCDGTTGSERDPVDRRVVGICASFVARYRSSCVRSVGVCVDRVCVTAVSCDGVCRCLCQLGLGDRCVSVSVPAVCVASVCGIRVGHIGVGVCVGVCVGVSVRSLSTSASASLAGLRIVSVGVRVGGGGDIVNVRAVAQVFETGGSRACLIRFVDCGRRNRFTCGHCVSRANFVESPSLPHRFASPPLSITHDLERRQQFAIWPCDAK